ncbi:hypothetical protein [Nostoc parmelioides]|uniref:Uncharacterized protein n=1 Tax=Nostoc parmelioides FACHB-3921 TaxID=2692909 RepID=A0ABR8BBV9_9NOSO|nr:hypothetical protein [Nostoc parmelioides]MBD2251331.1 hypothetical protein [Nostoc parmelioides FACHB-3921]
MIVEYVSVPFFSQIGISWLNNCVLLLGKENNPQGVSGITYTNLINDCNTSLGEDAMPVATTRGTAATRWLINRVSTDGLF